MTQAKYHINDEFFPFDRMTFSLDPRVLAISQKFMGVPRFVWKDPDLEVERHEVPGFQGGRIEVLMMKPHGIATPAPCFVDIHGGGFVYEAAPSHYRLAMAYAKRVGCIVAFVRYRLAPAYQFPVPQEDCYAALQWLYENAEQLAIDRTRIGIGGDSAGGTLAVTSCLMARDRGALIEPLFQMLVYPWLDGRMNSDSHRRFPDTPMWNSTLSKAVQPLINPDPDATPLAYRSPVEAESLYGLPPAYIEVAEYDCLRDDGILYARLLNETGIPAELHESRGTMHGFETRLDAPTTQQMVACRIAFMRRMFSMAEDAAEAMDRMIDDMVSSSLLVKMLQSAEKNLVTCSAHDITRNQFMLTGALAKRGYDWWWHSFTGRHAQTGEEKSFFIEFFTCNPALGGAEPVLGQLPANKQANKQPSYLMVKAGCWGPDACQLHRFFGWDDVDVGLGVPFHVAADDCLCCETDLIGRVDVSEADMAAHPEWMCDAGSMLFDLRVDKRIAFNVGYGASAPLRMLGAFDMAWHAEGIECAYEGTVVFNGETYLVDPETCFGYADKNWGVDFTSPWVWLSSCDMTSTLSGRQLRNSAFDIGGGRPVVFGHALDRKLLGCINYEGRAFEFNFSKPWTRSTTSFDCWETDDALYWHVVQEASDAKLVTDITCPKAEMLLINYESPDGAKRHNRLWNGGTGYGRLQLFEKREGDYALIDDIRVSHVGCEYGEYDKRDEDGERGA